MLKNSILFVNTLLAFFIMSTGCSKDEKINLTKSSDMANLNKNIWTRLSEKSIFFGHQSVGKNIIDGMAELKNESNASSFIILDLKENSDIQQSVFVHTKIGVNFDPKSKIDEFVSILENGLADSLDIAFLKLGYVDISKHTNIEELFKYYQTSVNSLQEKYPHLKIIHFTVPLITKPKGLKGIVKRLLKLDTNIYGHKYNELLRNHYGGIELFDIAKIEATFPDNTLNIYGGGIPGLIPGYSSDGGHLNQHGRLLVAHELISKLQIIIDSSN
jgi:hypothetical protein